MPPIAPMTAGSVPNVISTAPPMSHSAQAPSTVGDRLNVGVGPLLQEFAGEMMGEAYSGERIVQRAGLSFAAARSSGSVLNDDFWLTSAPADAADEDGRREIAFVS